MMKRLLLMGMIAITAWPTQTWAAMVNRAEVRRKLNRIIVDARDQKTVHDWIMNSRALSRLDREMLLSAPNLPEKMPPVTRRFNDQELTVSVDGITADFQNIHQGELILNGEKIHFPRRLDLASTVALINRHLKQKSAAHWSSWLSPELAEAESIRPTCITSQYEFIFRSPSALLESNFGYAGSLFVATLVISSLNVVTSIFSHCDVQVAELQKLLEEGNIGLKEIDCGSDASGSDRKMEFWIPEIDKKGTGKTRAFDLDYTLLVAQDAHKEDEEEEEEGKKPAAKPEPALYVFGYKDLQEVRVRKEDLKQNRYYCDNVLPGSERFTKFKEEIEPFRKVFEYIGNYNTCYSCHYQLLRNLRTPRSPDYVVKHAKALAKQQKAAKRGKASAKSREDAEGPGVKPAH